MSVRVVEYTEQDIEWPWNGDPQIWVGDEDCKSAFGQRNIRVDPIPAYPNDPKIVRSMLDFVSHLWPVSWPVTFYVLPRDITSRLNGGAYCDYDYRKPYEQRDKRLDYVASVTLSAKRIMHHPGMTRYLVAHEYGHVVEDFINTAIRSNDLGTQETEREYAEIRGLEMPRHGASAGKWHITPCEVLANDFRILMCGVETEYWPHPGVPYPTATFARNSGIGTWWLTRRLECWEFMKELKKGDANEAIDAA